MKLLLDTHALVWWVSSPEVLSRKANSAIEKTLTEETPIYASCISVWEIGMLIAKGRLTLPASLAEWVRALEAIPLLRFVPVDNPIAIDTLHLPDFDHPDPADRMIVATARSLSATLVTKDAILRRYRHVRSLW